MFVPSHATIRLNLHVIISEKAVTHGSKRGSILLSCQLQEFAEFIILLCIEGCFFLDCLLECTEDFFIRGTAESALYRRDLLNDRFYRFFVLDHGDDSTNLSFDATETISDALFLCRIFDFHRNL